MDELHFISSETDDLTFVFGDPDEFVLINPEKGDTGPQGAAGISYVDMATYIGGAPDANEVILRIGISYGIQLDPSRCKISCDIAPVLDAVFTCTIDNTVFATMTIAAGTTTGTVNITQLVLTPGILRIVAPDPQDVTLANISPTLAGTRVNP